MGSVDEVLYHWFWNQVKFSFPSSFLKQYFVYIILITCTFYIQTCLFMYMCVNLYTHT